LPSPYYLEVLLKRKVPYISYVNELCTITVTLEKYSNTFSNIILFKSTSLHIYAIFLFFLGLEVNGGDESIYV